MNPGRDALNGVALAALLATVAVALLSMVWLRHRQGRAAGGGEATAIRRPGGPVDAGLALLVMLWLSGLFSLVFSRIATGQWLHPSPPLAAGLPGTALGGLAGAGVAWLRFGLRALGFRAFKATWAVFALVAVPAFLALSTGWLWLLARCELEVPPQQIVGLFGEGPEVAALALVYGLILAPVVEEILFRGALLIVVAERAGPAAAVLGTAVLFGVMHIADPAAVLPLTLLGVVLGTLRVRSGSLWPPLLLHVGNNLCAVGMHWLGS